MVMDVERLEQEFIAWINKEERIVTFRKVLKSLLSGRRKIRCPMSMICVSPDIGSCKEGVYETVHKAEGVFLGR